MKTLLVVALAGCMMIGCAESTQENKKEEAVAFAKAEETTASSQEDYASFGAEISATDAMTQAEINEKYAQLKPGDTAVVKFEAPINAVCKSKGCWMRLDIAQEEEVFVKFKDYGFFVPLDAEGQAIVEGKAYLEEVSVDELQHMAKDAGKTAEEIAAITESKRELRFMADGVLIKAN